LRLSDGRLLSLHQGDFVVVNPEDWTWKRLGRLQGREPGQEPPQVRDWLVLGEDLYLACDMQLARVRGIVRLAPP
jgi:hypothetical protein